MLKGVWCSFLQKILNCIRYPVHSIIGECIGMACTVGCLVHESDVAVEAGAAVVVGQVLAELTAADACNPATDVIGICQLVA